MKLPPPAVNPEIGDAVVAVHEKVVPTTFEVRLTWVLVAPEQMVCASGQFDTVALGFTVTACVVVVPGHPPNEEVIV